MDVLDEHLLDEVEISDHGRSLEEQEHSRNGCLALELVVYPFTDVA